jgi:hypothetical protein
MPGAAGVSGAAAWPCGPVVGRETPGTVEAPVSPAVKICAAMVAAGSAAAVEAVVGAVHSIQEVGQRSNSGPVIGEHCNVLLDGQSQGLVVGGQGIAVQGHCCHSQSGDCRIACWDVGLCSACHA